MDDKAEAEPETVLAKYYQWYLISSFVPHNEEHTSMFCNDPIFNEDSNSVINFLPDHAVCAYKETREMNCLNDFVMDTIQSPQLIID